MAETKHPGFDTGQAGLCSVSLGKLGESQAVGMTGQLHLLSTGYPKQLARRLELGSSPDVGVLS